MTAGRLYLHIGPPKTATTALQLALQDLDLEGFRYVGISQPRDPGAREPGKDLYQFARDGHAGGAAEAGREIASLVASGVSVVMSEELLLLGHGKTRFRDKLARLRDIMREIPITVLLTVREPHEALRSFYQERFPQLPFAQQMSFRRFCEDHAAGCYDYSAVIRTLKDLGYDAARLIRFEDIISGRLTLGGLLGDARWQGLPLDVGVANASRRASDSNARHFPAVTLSAVRAPLLGKVVRRTPLAKVPVRPGGPRALDIPPAVAARLERGYAEVLSLIDAQDSGSAGSRSTAVRS